MTPSSSRREPVLAEKSAPEPGNTLPRRLLLGGAAGLTGSVLLGGGPASGGSHTLTAQEARRQARLVRPRLSLPSGIAIGEVGTDSAVLWARSSGVGRLIATLIETDDDGTPRGGRFSWRRILTGRWNSPGAAVPESDFTAKLWASALRPGTRYRLEMQFEDPSRCVLNP